MSEEQEKTIGFKDMPLGDMSQFDPEKFLELSDEDKAAFREKFTAKIAAIRAEWDAAVAAEAANEKPKKARGAKKKQLDLDTPLEKL